MKKKIKTVHPMQPVEYYNGAVRFKSNAIVNYLLDHGGIDMNALAVLKFSTEDREQFAQLIGYSVSGFGDLSYVRNATVKAADNLVDEFLKQKNANSEEN